MSGINGQATVTPGGGITQVAADARYLKLSGGTMANDLNMDGNSIIAAAITGSSVSATTISGSTFSGIILAVSTITSSRALDASSDDVISVSAASGNVVLTLPSAEAAGAIGHCFRIKRIDSSGNTVTLNRAGADTIDGGTSVAFAALQARDIIGLTTTTWGIF